MADEKRKDKKRGEDKIRSPLFHIEAREFKQTFFRDLKDIKNFYLEAEQQDRLKTMNPFAVFFYFIGWLLKSLFLKLTPARRFMLLIAFIFLAGSNITFSLGTTYFSFDFRLVGAIIMVFILMLELKDKLLAKGELAEGRAIQHRLLPDPSPAIPGWDVWLFSRPANDVGGDLLDCISFSRSHHLLVLGDVSGKGLPAALLMVKLQSFIRALASEANPLSHLGKQVNHIFHRDGISSSFATLLVLDIRRDSRRVLLLNAGHMPPIIIRSGRTVSLAKGDSGFGLKPDSTYGVIEEDLEPADVLVAYSDGISECHQEQGECFGVERLHKLLPALQDLPAAEIGARILAAVQNFCGDTRPPDDQSLLILRRNP